ncbi:phosphatidylserine/phosphatidylglycerophosphate/cardiolipin synthase [Halochromatium salexigens]|uniref:Phosphatidylserine/phosphatidylglycerophosphate/ cardiolipin synthase n=2 Tax=Halochromatium salexigens TaxID=49447 RepID=A0AAJ0UDJ4_HALSE|nr:phosphatidylserine/phosphatidylglycerophosphate/cardiolipin synthase [Halochromatium salexigens]
MTLVPGHNCWRVETASRVGLCVDGECYFSMLRQSLIAARRCIAIAAWDIHSRLELVRPDPGDGWPTAFGDLLTRLLDLRHELEIFILLWDYAPIYALEREPLFFGEVPWHKDAKKRHPRLHFILDDQHPLLGSQHQKLVLIDGALAWSGGFDISKWRWDSEAHRADEPRRRDPDGDPYPPFHDLQLLLDGAAARALGELFAERWARAGGGVPSVLQAQGSHHSVDTEARSDPWPESLEPLLREQAIGIARTLPRFKEYAEVREVEQLYLDMIAAARELIYIENQYLTSRAVADALRCSLSRPEGPQILIILPRETGHWLEQHTMDLIRARLLNELQSVDQHGRLHCVYPDLPALGDDCLMVHAKLMITDDRVLRLGSSNLSNRSMGLDSECDLCLIGESEAARTQIQQLRRRLLGMFLWRSPEEVAHIEQDAGAVASGTASARWGRALARLLDDEQPPKRAEAGDERLYLRVLEPELDPEWNRQLPDERLIDPDRSLSPDWVGDVVVGDELEPQARWRALFGIGLVLAFLVLAALWRWTPVGDWLEPQRLAETARTLTHSAWGVPIVLTAFVIASLVAVPVTLLILVTTLVFDPLLGALIALVASAIAAVGGYGIGHYTGAKTAKKRLGGRLGELRERLTKGGIFTVVTLRIVPVAPFAVLNLLAGALQVRFRDYVLGTLIGMAPGVIAMALFSEGLLKLLGRTDMRSLALVVGAVVLGGGLLWLGHRMLRKHV